jgi:hypothetical protein
MGTQGFQQLLAQGKFAVNATLSPLNTNDHALAIDVADLQTAQLATAQATGIHGQEHRVMRQIFR